MFEVVIESPQIRVSSRRHEYRYAVDESLPNPLESVFAALAACAGVYALKTARKLGLDASDLRISARPVTRIGEAVIPVKWMTKVTFPPDWKDEDKDAVMASIEVCAVKHLILNGGNIDFETSYETAASVKDSAPQS